MGRSVMTYEYTVAFIPFDCHHENCQWEYEDMVENIAETIQHYYPSFNEVKNEWHGREGRVILENMHGKIVVCEYCGLVSINLVPNDDTSWYYEPTEALRDAWCERIAGYMEKRFDGWGRLSPLGTMSNGVTVFERAS